MTEDVTHLLVENAQLGHLGSVSGVLPAEVLPTPTASI